MKALIKVVVLTVVMLTTTKMSNDDDDDCGDDKDTDGNLTYTFTHSNTYASNICKHIFVPQTHVCTLFFC